METITNKFNNDKDGKKWEAPVLIIQNIEDTEKLHIITDFFHHS